MSDDFYPFVDSGDPAPDNRHLTGHAEEGASPAAASEPARYATRIAVYDDMLSTPRVIVIEPQDVRTYLEEVTNTVYKCMREQGGSISLMVIREIVENFIHAHFMEPIISILDGGNTVRFADQGPGIEDKERAFEFGVTSADRDKKRYIRGTGAGFPMVQQYLENAGGAVSIEDNLGQGTVVTVTVDAERVREVERSAARGAAVRAASRPRGAQDTGSTAAVKNSMGAGAWGPGAPQTAPMGGQAATAWPQQPGYQQQGAPIAAGSYHPGAPQAWPGANPWGGWGAQAQPWQNPYQQGYAAWGAPAQSMTPTGRAIPSMAGAQMPQAAPAAGPHVSERGAQALAFLASHGSAGPTDLAQALGSSNATWSRELEALTGAGLTIKQGQKRVLTEMGKLWVSNALPQAPQGAGAAAPQQVPMAGAPAAGGTMDPMSWTAGQMPMAPSPAAGNTPQTWGVAASAPETAAGTAPQAAAGFPAGQAPYPVPAP